MSWRPIKFKFFCIPAKGFIENYKYNGEVDDLFNGEDPLLVPLQYTGIQDSEQKEIWEGDIVEFERVLTEEVTRKYTGVVEYEDGAYIIFAKAANLESTLMHIWLHDIIKKSGFVKIKVIGNKFETPGLTSR